MEKKEQVLKEIEQAFDITINNMDIIKKALADAYKLIKGDDNDN